MEFCPFYPQDICSFNRSSLFTLISLQGPLPRMVTHNTTAITFRDYMLGADHFYFFYFPSEYLGFPNVGKSR